MTVAEFYKNCDCKSSLRVKSGYNDKILCYAFDPNKHTEIGKRKISCVWAELQISKCIGFRNYAQPIICCYVNGAEEYQKEQEKNDR